MSDRFQAESAPQIRTCLRRLRRDAKLKMCKPKMCGVRCGRQRAATHKNVDRNPEIAERNAEMPSAMNRRPGAERRYDEADEKIGASQREYEIILRSISKVALEQNRP